MIEMEEELLLKVAEAEAEALSKKRRHMEGEENSKTNKKVRVREDEEGIYMVALRGSNSLRWQQLNINSKKKETENSSYKKNIISNNGCTQEKNCPCGIGTCLVLTANTERNQGRKFFKCPVRQENGGCGYFEWCDSGNIIIISNSNSNSNATSDVECPCGAGFCLILTARTGKNIGQRFYKCPANQGSSCGFFKSCNDNVTASSAVNSNYELSNKSYGSSCFQCGNEGHWARDCPASSVASTAASHMPADSGAKVTASGTCYKCGKPGHWARNCTSVHQK